MSYYSISPALPKTRGALPRLRPAVYPRPSPLVTFPPPRPPTRIPTLPAEIIDLVVHELDAGSEWTDEETGERIYEINEGEVPWDDLQACSLASKAFLGPARARLYFTAFVEVETNRAYQRLSERRRRDETKEHTILTSTEQLLETTLALNPHLAKYVREIHISLGARPCPALMIPNLALAHLLRVCPLVKSLTVTQPGPVKRLGSHLYIVLDVEVEAIANVLLACHPALSRVDLHAVTFETTAGRVAFYNAVAQIPSLRRLYLGSCHAGPAGHHISGTCAQIGRAHV